MFSILYECTSILHNAHCTIHISSTILYSIAPADHWLHSWPCVLCRTSPRGPSPSTRSPRSARTSSELPYSTMILWKTWRPRRLRWVKTIFLNYKFIMDTFVFKSLNFSFLFKQNSGHNWRIWQITLQFFCQVKCFSSVF